MKTNATTITPRDLLELEFDASTGELRVEFEIGEDRTTHHFSLDPKLDDPILARHFHDVTSHLAREVQARREGKRTPPCATCTGACCRGWDVRITARDMDRLTEVLGRRAPRVIERYPHRLPTNEIGHMRKVPWKNPATGTTEEACALLGKDGRCSVYDARPDACRAFSAWQCDMHEVWPANKRRLPLVRSLDHGKAKR